MAKIKSLQCKLFLQNIIKGKIAEEIAKLDYESHGYEVIRTGIGSDFRAIKKTISNRYEEFVDVKSGNARLSKKQLETKNHLKRQGIPYSTYRVTDSHLEFQVSNNSHIKEICQKLGFYAVKFYAGAILDETTCPNCKLVVSDPGTILSDFGLRNMGNGEVRVQSWCKNCRNDLKKKRKGGALIL